MYLEPPCECSGCNPYGARMDCKYDDHDQESIRQFGVYVTYVEHGNTPLMSLPYWVSEVARLVSRFRSEREIREIHDIREREKSQKMARAAGIMR